MVAVETLRLPLKDCEKAPPPTVSFGSFATGASRQQGKPCAVCPESGSFQGTGGSARPLMPR